MSFTIQAPLAPLAALLISLHDLSPGDLQAIRLS
jgi:hypothetical protein